ncbi:MAG TPA: hypothetical protein VKZ53_02990 [Candidatus Angelobacter sp.]|jgi:predicted metal-dependent phosphoesterase TrpH|nr:hypothetical protein [Candidatus Angelobacter sp.]
MLKGAIHVHSTFSDGEFTLRELRETFLAEGNHFVCVTDHAQAFDPPKLEAYVRECASLSSDQFLFIPSLEFECYERMHILGYGITSLIESPDPQEVIQCIERAGGISVIAHPKDSALAWIESFEVLPSGIEAWNSKYDGRYAPRPAVFQLLHRLQKRKPEMRAFYGQDLHWKKQFRGLLNTLPSAALAREDILTAFRSGDYQAQKGGLLLPSDGRLPETLMARFEKIHRRSDWMRSLMKRSKKVVDGIGMGVPSSLKSHLRRIF